MEKTMQAITFSEMIDNFSMLMDKVNDDHEPLIIITREHQKPVVMMSLDWQKTKLQWFNFLHG
jgi:PHD/YefM family antitoxin component YafN of YafNO toxin-antitoxin module